MLGVPQLITATQRRYAELALASNPQWLAPFISKVQDNRLSGPLFDMPRFAGNLESACTAIHDRWQTAFAPDRIKL